MIHSTGSDLRICQAQRNHHHPSCTWRKTFPALLISQFMRHASRSCIVAMPLRSLPRGSIAPRSARGGAAWRVCGVGAGVGRIIQRRWASDKKELGKDEDKPFYLQLNESIFERVQKEKAEQIKIQSLQQRTARGQFFATVFGMDSTYMLVVAHTKNDQHVSSPQV
jgi:hypothetical protein